MRILLTGGGTGGHILPNIALAEAIRARYKVFSADVDRELNLLYIGSKTPLEKKLCDNAHIPFRPILSGKLRRYWSIKNIVDIPKIPLGIFQAFLLIRKFNPDIVFSKGGYASVPVVIASWLLGKKIIIHESDVIPGLATKICLRFANEIFLGWQETSHYLNHKKNSHLTGIPLRKELLTGNADRARQKFSLQPGKPVLLVIGGSLGAERINKLIEKVAPRLTKTFQIVHICGIGKTSDSTPLLPYYQQIEYVTDDLFDLYAVSDLIVSRAGANTIAELLTLQKKTLLIPLPLSASRGDQLKNAEVASHLSQNIAVCKEEDLNEERLMQGIATLYRKPHHTSSIASLHQNATDRIIELILKN